MHPCRLSEYLILRDGEGHDPEKSQRKKGTKTKTAYYQN
jgi:hypothetical protein